MDLSHDPKWLLCGETPTYVATEVRDTTEHNKHKSKKTCESCSLACVCEFRLHDEWLFCTDIMLVFGWQTIERARGISMSTHGVEQSYKRCSCRMLCRSNFSNYCSRSLITQKKYLMFISIWIQILFGCFVWKNLCQWAMLQQAANA